eukprot:6775523-Pyramimonas_sp.AAC.1
MSVAYLSLLLLMFIRFVAMRLQLSHRPGRHGKDRHVLSGAASRVMLACPAPLAWGSRGLFSNSRGQAIAIDSGNSSTSSSQGGYRVLLWRPSWEKLHPTREGGGVWA